MKTTSKSKWAAVVIGGMAILNVEVALSMPVATASVSFDWNSIKASSVDGGSITWVPGSLNTVVTPSFGDAITGSQASQTGSVFANSVMDYDLSSVSAADSSSHQSMDFTVTCAGGAGTGCSFDFSMFYTLNAMLEDSAKFISSSIANASFDISLLGMASWGPFSLGSNGACIQLESTGSTNPSCSLIPQSGLLSTGPISLFDGDIITFAADAMTFANVSALTGVTVNSAVSSVPEPSAVLLIFSALIGFLGLTRQKSALFV